MKNILLIALAASATVSQAQLFGVGGNAAVGYDFYQINTTTGAATSLFSFVVPNSIGVTGLTYVPTTNKFLTTAAISANFSQMVEIDAGAQTATIVSTGIPTNGFGTPYQEGLEYMSSLGGVVVSYGPGGFYTDKLALLNPVGYGLMNSSVPPSLQDADTVFMDGTGALNIMDSNNPTSGFMRNKVGTPFSGPTLTGFGSNMFAAADADFAWKADEGKLFLTQTSNLAVVNPSSTTITAIGSYGANSNGVVNRITGIAAKPVPEPATFAALGLGGVALLKRRRSN